jgi:CRISPR/Cas system CMR-associated protein Cmr5 small subunit
MTARSSGWRSHRVPTIFQSPGLIATWATNELSTAGNISDLAYHGTVDEHLLDAEDNHVPRPPIEVTYS